METGKYYKQNQLLLDSVNESEWIVALDKCREHVKLRIGKNLLFGAHNEQRLGSDPIDYYVSYAYNAIINGSWEWKKGHSLTEQMIRIADSTISTEVEKVGTKKYKESRIVLKNIDDLFYTDDEPVDDSNLELKEKLEVRIKKIEQIIDPDEKLKDFWECIKAGMKPNEIADLMDLTPKQLYKLRERFTQRIQISPLFKELI
jgi:hypothetical protein